MKWKKYVCVCVCDCEEKVTEFSEMFSNRSLEEILKPQPLFKTNNNKNTYGFLKGCTRLTDIRRDCFLRIRNCLDILRIFI